MAAPDDTETQTAPDYSGASPEVLRALLNQPAAAGAAGSGAAPIDYGTLAQQLLQQPTLPQPDTTPVTRGLLSRLGEALGGGQTTGVMSPAQQEMAGLRALQHFGTSLIAGSGYHPGQPALGAFAEGFEGAAQSERGSEQGAAATLAAQQQYAGGQQQQYLERLKMALPLLQMQRAGAVPNVLASGPAVPGTAGGAGTPSGSGLTLTPFIAKNLPAGVSPAEDQMVRTVWGEARGEPLAGQQGVAAVIKNRMAAGNQDAQGVIFKPGAFSSWADKQRPDMEALSPSDPTYQDILNKAVRPVMSGDAQDPSGGATYFYAPKLMPGGGPSWAANQQPSATIGGHQFYKLPYGAPPTAQVAGPGAPTGGPAATPAPITPAPTETPPVASTAPAGTPAPDTRPDDALTWEEFQARHGTPITAASRPDLVVPVDPQRTAELQSSMAQAKRDVDYALTPADKTKAQAQYTDASAKLGTLQQDAAAKTAANILAAQTEKGKLLSPLYQKAKEQAQAPVLEKQRGDQAIQVENIKAGNTYHQQLDKESAEYAQANTIKPMSEQALKAHQMNNGLSQLLPVMQDLPAGGGLVGSILDAHPDMAPLLDQAGVITDRQADATRLVNGLVASISSQMKPTGLGALREYEWNAFKAQLPSLLSTAQGQQKAVVMLMNMNNRIQDEGNWMNNYFNRQVPDQYSQKPGATRTAHNLDLPSDSKYLSPQQMMDEQLGPIVPSYTPPKGTPVTASGQAQWEQSLPPGKPYYKTYAVPDPKNPGQPKRDSAGNVVTTKSLEVRPWQ